ncbi:MAG: S46 family peptidase [Massilia sp.]
MLRPIILSLALVGAVGGAQASEGMWQPDQLPLLKPQLARIGINLPLSDPSRHPLAAIVSTGNCSASFVSADGLIVTNHHCVAPSIALNSTPEHNYMANGFVARTRAAELPTVRGAVVLVTDRTENVTERLTRGLPAGSGRERHDEMQSRIRALNAECETERYYRCQVVAALRGLVYYRVRQFRIRDVRLVYAPSEKIGNFGGDVDNFEWPRQVGDFAFLRAYVGKDGRPAEPSADNVPFKPRDFLVVSAEGVRNGDPILLAGFPGRTTRYKLPSEIRYARDVYFPARLAGMQADVAVIAASTMGSQGAGQRYAGLVKNFNSVIKRTQGLLDGFTTYDVAAIRDQEDADLRNWLRQNPSAGSREMLAELDVAVGADLALSSEEFALQVASHSDLINSARMLYRLALERQRPDGRRENGFQDRDVGGMRTRLAALDDTFALNVDEARYSSALQRYARLAQKARPKGLDALLPAPAAVPALYKGSELADVARRQAWIGRDVEAFRKSDDSIIKLAVKLQDIGTALDNRRKEVNGDLDRLMPQYMAAVIAWKKSQGRVVYSDANSTLRVSFGLVAPYSPRDGVSKGAFTTVDGVRQKNTGKEPFAAPRELLDAIREKRFGPFRDPALGTVPVNFISSADTTGGNSGSAVLNKRGELVGLNFDSTYESIVKDWYFDSAITRAIHVDIRYMLWVMKEVDHADNLLAELTVKYPRQSPNQSPDR